MKHRFTAMNPVIANGNTASETVPAENIRHADDLGVHSPDTLTGTVTVEVSEPGEADWDPYQADEGSAITLTAGEMIIFKAPGDMDLRLNSGSAEAAERQFRVDGYENL